MESDDASSKLRRKCQGNYAASAMFSASYVRITLC
jgi:hypothetical protein